LPEDAKKRTRATTESPKAHDEVAGDEEVATRRSVARATLLSQLDLMVSAELKEEDAMLTSHPIIAGMEAGIRRERLIADARKLSKKTVRVGSR
jgi:hypothetical protein